MAPLIEQTLLWLCLGWCHGDHQSRTKAAVHCLWDVLHEVEPGLRLHETKSCRTVATTMAQWRCTVPQGLSQKIIGTSRLHILIGFTVDGKLSIRNAMTRLKENGRDGGHLFAALWRAGDAWGPDEQLCALMIPSKKYLEQCVATEQASAAKKSVPKQKGNGGASISLSSLLAHSHAKARSPSPTISAPRTPSKCSSPSARPCDSDRDDGDLLQAKGVFRGNDCGSELLQLSMSAPVGWDPAQTATNLRLASVGNEISVMLEVPSAQSPQRRKHEEIWNDIKELAKSPEGTLTPGAKRRHIESTAAKMQNLSREALGAPNRAFEEGPETSVLFDSAVNRRLYQFTRTLPPNMTLQRSARPGQPLAGQVHVGSDGRIIAEVYPVHGSETPTAAGALAQRNN